MEAIEFLILMFLSFAVCGATFFCIAFGINSDKSLPFAPNPILIIPGILLGSAVLLGGSWVIEKGLLLAMLITMAVVVVEGMFSVKNKTFSRRQNRKPPIRLTFLWHWGVSIGDFILLPIWNGLVVVHLQISLVYILYLVLSTIITLIAHWLWWPREEKALNFMCPDWSGSGKKGKYRFTDMSMAGWIHFWFMVFQLILIFGYVFTPMPAYVVKATGIIMLIFIPVAVIEPGIVEGWPMTKGKVVVTAMVAIGLISALAIVNSLKF